MNKILKSTGQLAIAAVIGVAGVAAAQPLPCKVIRVINPSAPGGNSDIVFRLFAGKMGELLGQQLVLDYRPGAGGTIGADMTAKAAPDGCTAAIVAASFVINPALIKKLPFDTVKDFTPLGLVVDIPTSVTVHPSLPVKNVKDLIALAKTKPGELFYSSSGPGTVGHLAGELLNSTVGIKLVHVPYKGIAPGVVDLIAGQVQLSFPSIPVVIENVRSGKLKMIAQCGNTRSSSVPDVPTMQEGGLKGFVVSSGFSFIGPAGMPKAVVEKLNGALAKSLQDPTVRKELVSRGADPVGNSPEQHGAYIKAEIEKWQKVAAHAGIQPE
ncbi:MAG: tripartite tricarboxylate transporter substrate binding protein [Betaproteobacteria bacterium]|nr:tripartite tricarboxylate transporter substrate binding protein [Betaproteobacteria bacterium]